MTQVQPVSRNLALALMEASEAGHDPSFYHRGVRVRVYLDRATGSWEDVGSEDAAADWLRSKLDEGGERRE